MQATPSTTKKRWPWTGAYYGWMIVAVTAALQFAGGTPTFPVLGLFLEPMVNEFGWSRASYSLPLTIGTIIGGFGGAITGPAFDKYGPRWIMTISAVIVGSSFFLMGFIHEYWQYFILQIVTRSVTAAAFFMVVGVVLPKWFIAKRGRATAISGLGGRAGQFATPLFVAAIIVGLGWRQAWMGLGLTIWLIAIPPVFFFLRGKPEDMGLLPDGVTAEEAAAARAEADRQAAAGAKNVGTEVSFTLKEAMHTRAFYLMTLGQTTLALVISGLHFHWFAYMTSQGLSESTAVGSIAVSSLAGIPSSLVAGYLTERIHVRHILTVTSLGFGLSVVMLIYTQSTFMAYAYGISLGIFSGMMFTVTLVIYADYFGRDHLGSIRGIVSPIQQITNASGPLVASIAYDSTGNYNAILWTFAILTTVTAFCWMQATQPVRPTTPRLEAGALSD
ncbi:MAG: MFS transporter [Chloroflexi bacterium]|nr:MAG: MFS transporter [Chloroflexota bacterium]